MTVDELLAKHGVKLPSTAPGQHYSTCPKCSAKRAKKNDKCLGIKIDDKGVCWRCNHCDWTGPEKPPDAGGTKKRGGKWTTLAEYIYRDANGAPYLKVRKCLDENGEKQYPQFHWDGTAWAKGKPKLNGKVAPKIPYLLQRLIAAPLSAMTYFVEGEQNVDDLAKLGFVATTASEGASAKWDPALTPYCKDRHVVILPDADKPGRAHALKVAGAINDVAASLRILDLFPDRQDGSDVSDWLVDDTAGAKLAKLARDAPLWEPSADPSADDEKPRAEPPSADDDAELERLARLSLLDYERARKEGGKRLGISRLALLDVLVKAKRAELRLDKGDGKAGRPIEFATPEPWQDPVDGAALLNALSTVIGEHVITEKRFCDAAALWVVHTYLLDHFQVTPRLLVRSPIKRCGKSTLLRVLTCVVFKPLSTSSVTASVTFRVIEKHRPCLLIDEADMLLRSKDESKDLYSVLLDGHGRGGQTIRNVSVSDDYEPRAFDNFAAVAFASIGKLLDTLTDRSIVIDLKRRKRSEQVKRRFRFDRVDHLTELARKAMRWVTDHGERVTAIDPDMPDSIFDRAADNWRPLLAIADAVGGKWPERARKVAVEICGVEDDDESARLELALGDIRGIFERRKVDDPPWADRISSAGLIEQMVEIVPRPWAEYGKGGKPISPNKLARLLKPLDIAPQVVRIGEATPSGYYRRQFEDAWERHLAPIEGLSPSGGSTNLNSLNNADGIGTSELFSNLNNGPDVEVSKSRRNAATTGIVEAVEVGKGGLGKEGLSNGRVPGLSEHRVLQFASWYDDHADAQRQATGEVDQVALDAELKQALAAEVLPEFVETEFERVIAAVFGG